MLRELAEMAHQERTRTLQDSLIEHGRQAIRNLTGVHDLHLTVTAIKVYASPQLVEFHADGIDFQYDVRIVTESNGEVGSRRVEYETTSERVGVKHNRVFTAVKDMADIGRLFEGVPLPNLDVREPTVEEVIAREREPLTEPSSD